VADLLEISARIIDSGIVDRPINRTSNELSEVFDGIAVVESFSHSVVLRTPDGLVAFDASGHLTGERVVAELRRWSTDAVRSLVYTHGHLDHVGGSGYFASDATTRGYDTPAVIAHRAVVDRFDRYRRTDGFNTSINVRQFGWQRNKDMGIGGGAGTPGSTTERKFLPDDVLAPSSTYDQTHTFQVGDVTVDLHHGKGETDDHTWAWLPHARAVVSGDFLIWNFPNAGNPQKVQRYPREWAQSLREMAAKQPELLLPAHGLPISGRARIDKVLGHVADVLEQLHDEVVARMNAGQDLDTILHEVRVADADLATPYLRPLYDDPEFVVRNIWRLYGGWWDGDAAHLKPARRDVLAAEVAALSGGAVVLARRAIAIVEDGGDLRLAGELAVLAYRADSHDAEVARSHTLVHEARKNAEPSLMAKGIFASAAAQSRHVDT
jgi:alkyl sulfatase BDS1-like metallo-beta-lactamase superfamily hydrolase